MPTGALPTIIFGGVAAKATEKVAEEGVKKIDEWSGAKAARDEETERARRMEEQGNQQIEDDKKRLNDIEDEKKREKDRLAQVALREAQRRRQRQVAQSRPAGGSLIGGSSSLGGSAYGGKSLLGQ